MKNIRKCADIQLLVAIKKDRALNDRHRKIDNFC
jgi:hypothetical protein